MSDYLFEQLDPERFQHLAQAVLAKAFPDLQCLPVGQPDGGRDAIRWVEGPSGKFIGYQVKFVRRPQDRGEVLDWLAETMERESKKVSRLQKRGMARYVLVTNAAGTAHMESGSIDRAQQILDGLDVPAICWWRDDISRRLDDAWDIKWMYPDLWTGLDAVRALLESGLSEDYERRYSALTAYTAFHYDQDQRVHFRQIDLEKPLADLFVDVPTAIPMQHERRRKRRFNVQLLTALDRLASEPNVDDAEEEQYVAHHREFIVGAARLLLDSDVAAGMPFVVIEGGPGQGKSTLSQLICQAHREGVLARGIQALPVQYRPRHQRIPFRVVLRDLAVWLDGQSPFGDTEESLPHERTLEGFLAASVRHASGGANFDVSDLQAVSRVSALLVVLDGLDEVADIELRRATVRAIEQGVNRLKAVAASLQVVITSRPTAFANSPSFESSDFKYLTLLSLPTELISDYSERWIRAKQLTAKDGAEVRRALEARLTQPHMRDLARNPMQLAILLALIHTTGTSLPDKRTTLYDEYMRVFFNREAEKDEIVREHRELLVDIHRYLAWLLHSEAEIGGAHGGVLTTDRLMEALRRYLQSEQQPVDFVEGLFHGLVDRVGALVSRVEGTWEFEVQPVREYFAARHLYETAPYSPPGKEVSGTKPDRFDALARNFYWLNVVRFYGGCFSKGELADLADRVAELGRDPHLRDITHPRQLAAMLLADYVFAQQPRAVDDVVRFLFEGQGLRRIVVTASPSRRHDALTLPVGSGREELVSEALAELARHPIADYALELCDTVIANTSLEERIDLWVGRALGASGSERTAWFTYGMWLRLLNRIDHSVIDQLLDDGKDVDRRLATLMAGGSVDYCHATTERSMAVVRSVLDGRRNFLGAPNRSPLAAFASMLDTRSFDPVFLHRSQLGLGALQRRILNQSVRSLRQDRKEPLPAGNEAIDKAARVVDVVRHEARRSTEEWATSLDPWNRVVEAVRSEFGDCRLATRLAVLAAGIRSRDETYSHASDLLDRGESLCARYRHARLRSATTSYWTATLDRASRDTAVFEVLTPLFAWAGPSVLRELMPRLQKVLPTLSSMDYGQLVEVVRTVRTMSQDRPLSIRSMGLPKRMHPRLVVLLAERCTETDAVGLYQERLARYRGEDSTVLAFSARMAMNNLKEPEDWAEVIAIHRRCYERGVLPYLHVRSGREGRVPPMPLEVAKTIAKSPQAYPTEFSAAAEVILRERAAATVQPVAQVADSERWFTGSN
jgi:hypothetical protein